MLHLCDLGFSFLYFLFISWEQCFGADRGLCSKTIFFCLASCAFSYLKNGETGNNSHTLQSTDFQMCHSNLSSSFVRDRLGQMVQSVRRSLSSVSFRSCVAARLMNTALS